MQLQRSIARRDLAARSTSIVSRGTRSAYLENVGRRLVGIVIGFVLVRFTRNSKTKTRQNRKRHFTRPLSNRDAFAGANPLNNEKKRGPN